MAKLRLRLNRCELVVRPQAKISLQKFDTLLIIFATAEVFPTAFAALLCDHLCILGHGTTARHQALLRRRQRQKARKAAFASAGHGQIALRYRNFDAAIFSIEAKYAFRAEIWIF